MPENDSRKELRFAVMCRGTSFQRWQADAIRALIARGHQPVLLIRDGRTTEKRSVWGRLKSKKWQTVLFSFLDNRLFKPAAKKTVSLAEELGNTALIKCLPARKGHSEFFSEPDISTIRDYRPDFILRFAFGIIRGGILTAAPYGVWSFHHDDEQKYRGGPPGFWEIFRGDPVSGAILQRLTDTLDGGIVLKKGFLKTVRHSYKGNLEQLLSVSSAWPAEVAGMLTAKGRMPDIHPAEKDQLSKLPPVLKVPRNGAMIRFLVCLFMNRISFRISSLFAAEFWNAGVINRPVADVALSENGIRNEEIHWLSPAGRSRYFADPAGFILDDGLHILAENYDYRRGRAEISEITMPMATGIASSPVRVIGGELHYSYPYVFRDGEEIYCVPESYQSGCVMLYWRDPVTGKFTEYRKLIVGVEAVDPTLFHHDQRWWLFFTSRRNSNTHLFTWHSEKVEGPYIPHTMNPVKVDVRSARPAGTPFVYDGQLYRPAQDCSATYGGRIAINKVLRLTPDEFEEETVRYIAPVHGSLYNKGIHNISAAGSVTLIDGKRYLPDFHHFFRRLKARCKRKDQ